VILGAVNANRNPFIYLNNMGKVMTSGEAVGAKTLAFAAALAGTLAFPIGSGARAETGAWAETTHAKVRLISAVAATGDAKTVRLGLEIALAPGWKTYWRSPGEGGLPPKFDWSDSRNLAKPEVAWPAPKRFEIGGMESYGYADHVVLPIDAVLAEPGKPLAARLSLQYAVCREICMLVEARVALDLPARGDETAQSSSNAAAIARFQAEAPRPGAELGWRILGIKRHRIGGSGAEGRDVLVIDVANSGAAFEAPDLLVECPGIRFGKAMQKPVAEAGRLRFAAPVQWSEVPPPANPEIVLTLIDGKRAGTFTVRVDGLPPR
jgi:suppressor for copper-sensitivity B